MLSKQLFFSQTKELYKYFASNLKENFNLAVWLTSRTNVDNSNIIFTEENKYLIKLIKLMEFLANIFVLNDIVIRNYTVFCRVAVAKIQRRYLVAFESSYHLLTCPTTCDAGDFTLNFPMLNVNR